jgi:hypothetical protein
MLRLPDLRPGMRMSVQPFRRAFRWLNAHAGTTVAGDLVLADSAGGSAIATDRRRELDGRIVSHVSAGRYTVQLIAGQIGGGWSDLPPAPFTAYEYNANPAVPVGSHVRCRREQWTGELRFPASAC